MHGKKCVYVHVMVSFVSSSVRCDAYVLVPSTIGIFRNMLAVEIIVVDLAVERT